jgi:hypothetical protein
MLETKIPERLKLRYWNEINERIESAPLDDLMVAYRKAYKELRTEKTTG